MFPPDVSNFLVLPGQVPEGPEQERVGQELERKFQEKEQELERKFQEKEQELERKKEEFLKSQQPWY